MTQKSQLVERLPDLLRGKIVRTQDGHRVGKVSGLGNQSFEIDQGWFKHHHFRLDYDEITSARGNSIYVAVDPTTLKSGPGKEGSQKMENL